MTKLYFIAPLIALAIFAAVYARYARAYDARLEHARQVASDLKNRKLEEQAQAQQRAHREASEAIVRRQAERAEKDHADAAQKQARQETEQQRAMLAQQETRLRALLERLRAELAATGAATERRESEVRELEREREFLAAYVHEAEANRESLYALLEKFEATESQRLAVAATPPQPNVRR